MSATKALDLAGLLERFDALGRELFDDGVWPCDVGAVVLGEMADREGVARAVVTGTYRHTTKRSYLRATKAGRCARDVDGKYPEHHVWVVLGEGPEAALVDPNGELRGEPTAQPLAGTEARYVPLPEGSPWVTLQRDVTAAALVEEGWDSRLDEAYARLTAEDGERK